MERTTVQETTHQPTDEQASAESGATIASESALGKTARHISKRTTDLIAIAIVGIGVLQVSGRLAEWWQTDPSTVRSPRVSANETSGQPTRWGKGESAVSLLAGDQPVRMERRVITGDQDRVDGIVCERLIDILESESASADTSENHASESSSADFRQKESRLIGLLKDLTPIQQKAGHWNLYRLDTKENPLPGSFLIATRLPPNQTEAEQLVAWAIATPSSNNKWTSFVLTPKQTGNNSQKHATPIPTDGRIILSLDADSLEELTVFQRQHATPPDIARWVTELGDELTEAGWHEARAWRQSTNSAVARFEREGVSGQQPKQAMELSISLSEAGNLTGTSNVIAIPEMQLVPTEDTLRSRTLDGQ